MADVKIDKHKFDKIMQLLHNEFSGQQLALNYYPIVKKDVGNGLKLAVREKDLIWRRKMIRSISTRIESVRHDSVLYLTMPHTGYSETLEKGLPHNANIDKLRAWARSKLGLRGRELQRVTWFLWKKFKTQGAKPHPFRRRGVLMAYRMVVSDIRRHTAVITRKIRLNV